MKITTKKTSPVLILTPAQIARRTRNHGPWTKAYLDLIRLRRRDTTPTERN